ncbi:non-ribosomal peptide synthetase [Nostoc punctiforme NIES-2108]|uniref:Non-ribosomal peptide synthetase n=1 Tax=Nostoc punctiforme NIES-2108 TaxID=1356359 RepID=A0A367R9D5_NOSPU|nr:non-ribosomal peptide synthetase [Nostoc punctiforme NIES-2108]
MMTEELPLSYAQQRLWFLDQLEPNSAIYNIPLALRLVGNLNRAALEQSFQEIIDRHEALRTNFITVDGKPSQIIQAQINWTVSVVECEHLPPSEQEIATQQLAQQQAIQPFDLAEGALIRATLIVLSKTEHILLLCMHHIVSDAWSLGVFIQELAALYNAYSQGEPSPLTPLPIQYADFGIWQREWLQGEVLQNQISYWQQQLKDAPALLSLPTDRPRPAVQTFAGAIQEFALSVELSNQLTQLSQKQGVTLFMTLLAAFDTLLYRYTGQLDILVGSAIANREHSEIEGLIGFFVNTLVLRTDLSGNPSFSELLSRVRQIALGAYSHQELPFEMLVEALQPKRDLSHPPLFQVMFVLQNAPMSGVELAGLTISSLPPQSTIAKFDLTLSMHNSSAGLVGIWEYNTDLFDASTIERMSGHFVTLLSSIVANPEERISQLPLLSQTEQQQLLVEWNDTQADYPVDKCIHQLFEEQSVSTPDAVAVVFENQQLTYHQLNCRANYLAHYLQSLGIKPDTLVAICVERSIEMVVGLLGILKAGGAYVPLDPEYPTERLAFMLEDAQVSILLTQQRLIDRLPEHQAKLICLDEAWEQIAQNNQDNPTSEVKAFHLANLIYTSGSTGKPKGVMVEHKGLCNLAQAQIQTFGLTSDSRVLQFASFSFDASISEILMALGSGATLYLGTKDSLLPGKPLIEQLSNHCITHITLPPSALAVMPESELSALQTIIVAGEASSSELIRQWSAGRNFFNAYGPTEASVCATIAKCTDDDDKISIGKAIANVQVYILDEYLQPVPIGVPGELHIGGTGLSRGYLNRPELTQEKFIPNPFKGAGESKLYKTGDLARYLPDGNIEYLGRIDNQVKIRGFRIELGEIEELLNQHSDVQTACVIAREDNPGDKRLVAYVVGQKQDPPTINQLRSFLSSQLPQYMIPHAFVMLESLPLTPNGKVDRRALRAPDSREGLEISFVAPRSPIEEILTQIWTQALKVDQVGIYDNFFELGGHSLLATQLVSRIRNIFKVELPLREFFARKTVAELAQVIGQLQQQNLELVSPPILPRAENAELPLSYAQQRLWFLDQFEPNSAIYNIPMALRLVGTLNQVALEQSLYEIINRHEALRTNFVIVDGKPSQLIQTQTNWTVTVVDLKHLSTTEQEISTQQLAQQQANQPFDLANQALVKATLIVLSETEYVLSVCMHHIVSDAWSMGVFIQELAALYNAYSQGEPSPLTPLSIQYADFAIWQRNWLQGEVLQTQISYWQQQLKAAPALLSLPTDRPRPAVQTFAGGHQEFALSVELSNKLTKLSQEQGVTLFMTLLAAFDTLLYRYTGTEDILVGSPIANRNRSEIEGLIGFFVNTLVLRTDLSGDRSFNELLGRVRLMAIDAYAHQDLPFEMLVEVLQPERDLSHTPLFQVMFALQNVPMSEIELADLTISSLPVESATAKFDLFLSIQNTGNGLVGVWEYNTDLFDASTIERMTGHFITLLSGIVANPEERISQLPLLSQTEQQQLLVEWNNTLTDYPRDKSIHQLFEKQVERTPHAVAVEFENQQLTYNQLNCRANQLAHYLKSLGVSADVLVGICVERSLEMVVGLLGILKAGGAYVPLDPNYPQERLAFMLEDAQVSVLLTQHSILDRLPQHQAHLVFLDTDWRLISQSSQDNLISDVQATNLAYVIYTSGSTGKPKGVAMNQLALCNLILWQLQNNTISTGAKTLQFAPISFDVSFQEMFSTWFSGGTLFLITEELRRDTSALLGFLQQKAVERLFVPFVALQQLAEIAVGSELVNSHLREIITAGEQLQITPAISQWLSKLNDCTLHNHYGPSESHVIITFTLADQVEAWPLLPPIGRPIANTQIYILDKYLQPVPVGVAGELHIGGISLARGYLNRTELTQQRFIPNPFSTDGHSRLYKTGDLARYLPDANIEYLGRIDNQVKVRGFRIELGEVEAVLSQHGDVEGCCIIAHEDTQGDKRLVAYVVAHQHCTPTINELRQFLKAKLPDYMVPNAFVMLEEMPLTPSGKVDRRALPAPDLHSTNSDKYVAPRNQVELELTQIWSRILKVDKVGVKDNFFDLGGHSLLTPYLMAQIKQQFGKDIAIASLYQNPTIEQLATIVPFDSDSKSGSPLVILQPHGSKPPLFCLPGAAGYPFYLYDLALCLGSDQPFYSFQAIAPAEGGELITQVEDVAARYIQELFVVQPQGPYFLAGHSFGGKLAFEMAQQLLRKGHKVALVAILDTTAPFHQNNPSAFDLDNTKWLAELADTIEVVYGKKMDCSVDTLQSMVWEDQLKYVLERLKDADILPPDDEIMQLNNMVQLLKANAVVNYVPQEIYPTKITLFRAKENVVKVDESNSEVLSDILQDLHWGWSKFSAEPVNVHFVPGNHVTMMNLPHVQVLAEKLKACIEKAQEVTGDGYEPDCDNHIRPLKFLSNPHPVDIK